MSLDFDTPPFDTDAEGIVLSEALLSGPLAGLKPEHFYSRSNQKIYTAVLSVASKGEPTDLVRVASELRESGDMVDVGIGYLAETIALCQPTDAHPENHARRVRELWRRRVLIEALREVMVELYRGLGADEAWGRVKGICSGKAET